MALPGEATPGYVDEVRPEPVRYRIIDVFDYLNREDEYPRLTLEEAAARMDDLTGVGADVIIADALDGALPWEWVDDETGREVTLRLEIEPEVYPQNPNDLLGKLAASLKRPEDEVE